MVLGTQRGIGKSVVVGGLAMLLRRRRVPVDVFKPVAVGCRRTRHGPVSPDVEFLAHCADSPHELAVINPVRYRQTFAPAECARRERRPVDFDRIEQGLHGLSEGCSVLLIEGVGGLLEPLDEKRTMVELAAGWNTEVVVVAPSSVDAVNHVLMAVDCLRHRDVEPLAVLLNRYVAESAPWADEVNPEQIATYADVDVPLMLPHDPAISMEKGRMGEDILAALQPLAARLTERPAS